MLIKIELEAKEFFAIRHSLAKTERRSLFGTVGLSKKINDQLEEKVSSDDLALFEHEWKKSGQEMDKITAQRIEDNKKKFPPKVKKVIAKNKNKTNGTEKNVLKADN